MKRNGRYLAMLFVLSLILLVSAPAWLFASQSPNPLYSGRAQINGPLQLDMVASPPTVTPGSRLTLSLSLTNLTGEMQSPEIQIVLPPSLALDGLALPAGATFNLGENRLNWLPVLAANGGAQFFDLPLVANTAVIPNPEQTITAVLTANGQQYTTQTTIWVGIPPQTVDIQAPLQAAIGQPIQLRGEVNGSTPVIQTWSLGDGRQVQVADPVVVFPAAGVYDLTLHAENPVGSATAHHTITIVPHPAAQFAVADATVAVSQTVQFVNQSGGLSPLSYFWDFGDGFNSNEANPTHQYQAPGVYQVQLTTSNQFGSSQAYLDVTVGMPPEASLTLPVNGRVGEPLQGLAAGDASVTLYRWDAGDGRTVEGPFFEHTYTRTGNYYVRLTAENSYGGTEVGQWVRIDPGFLSTYLPLIMANSGGVETAVTVPRPGSESTPLTADIQLDQPFVMQPLDLPAGLSPSEQLFAYINEARAQFGLSPLNHISQLSTAAQQHTDDMARFGYTAHQGYDGSYPAERLLWAGYQAGYAGEATAWGFEYPYQAVEFWVNSPPHRRIILNPYATDVGVGYTVDFSAPNVWYWTAEFGNAFASANPPQIRLQEPESGVEAFVTSLLDFGWNWPLPLGSGEQFVVYVYDGSRTIRLGAVSQPVQDTRFNLQTAVSDLITTLGTFEWQVRLENNGSTTAESERRQIVFSWNPAVPTPTPAVTPTPVLTPTPTPSPTPEMTPLPPTPTPTPLPPLPTVPPVVTVSP